MLSIKGILCEKKLPFPFSWAGVLTFSQENLCHLMTSEPPPRSHPRRSLCLCVQSWSTPECCQLLINIAPPMHPFISILSPFVPGQVFNVSDLINVMYGCFISTCLESLVGEKYCKRLFIVFNYTEWRLKPYIHMSIHIYMCIYVCIYM